MASRSEQSALQTPSFVSAVLVTVHVVAAYTGVIPNGAHVSANTNKKVKTQVIDFFMNMANLPG
jgi:hypothetical protein